MAEVTYISYSARAKSTTADGIFAEAHQILDVSKNKNQQAINAEVTTELGKKVAKSDFDSFKTSNTSAIAAKADKSYVDTELGKKATKSELSAVDAKFAGVFCNVDEVINNGGEVCVSINTVDKKTVDINLPVYHKSVVDTKLGTKANSADVYTKTQVYTKNETDTKLGTKANSADVYTKAQADSAITAKVNAAVASVYRVKGTKATIAEVTALTNVKCGDVWNVTAEFTLGGKKYPAGTNVVALADKSAADAANWDALGGTVDLAGHTAEMKSWANGQFAGKAYEAKVTTNTSNISSLTTRVTAAEGKFAGYYTKGETDTKLGTKANSADVYTKSQVYTKEETETEAGYAARLALRTNHVLDISGVAVGVTVKMQSVSHHDGSVVLAIGATTMGSLKSTQLCLHANDGNYYANWQKTTAEEAAILNGYFVRTPDGNVYTQSGSTKEEACVVNAVKIVENVYKKNEVDTKLSSKANSADVYTKGTIDTKLAEKATTASVNSLTSRVGAVESKFSGYVPTATYNALAARVAELEALLKLA
nr:MAG TPA: hypothetical protein [Caudoviricetes sp.]